MERRTDATCGYADFIVHGALETVRPLRGLVLMNVSPYVQQITIGLILVAVVAFDPFAKSRRLK